MNDFCVKREQERLTRGMLDSELRSAFLNPISRDEHKRVDAEIKRRKANGTWTGGKE